MGQLKTSILTFSKAQCSAWIASVADFGTTIMLVSLMHLWYGYATCTGAFVGGIVNCCINYKWVFHTTDRKKKSIATRYLFVWIMSIAFNTYGTCLLKEMTGMNYIVAKTAVAVVVAVLWNYQMQRTFVFHASQGHARDDKGETEPAVTADMRHDDRLKA